MFDSSTQLHGLSLNSVLLTGPDLNNALLGVLLHFRKDLVLPHIQQMFYGFLVSREHRDSHARTRLWQYNEHRENKK